MKHPLSSSIITLKRFPIFLVGSDEDIIKGVIEIKPALAEGKDATILTIVWGSFLSLIDYIYK